MINDTIHKYWEPAFGSADWQGFISPHEFAGKSAWSLHLYKLSEFWATNFWAFQKHDELLCNGSEKCLDWHYHNLTRSYPDWRSCMDATFSLKPIKDQQPTTILTHKSSGELCDLDSIYSDESAGLDWWLCPLWLDLWPGKFPPSQCFLYLTPRDE